MMANGNMKQWCHRTLSLRWCGKQAGLLARHIRGIAHASGDDPVPETFAGARLT
jgi:hypothetical protein